MKTPQELEQEMLNRYQQSLQGSDNATKFSSLVCPHQYGKECPVCDLTYAYYKMKLGKEHPLRQKARDLNRKIRYYSNVIFPADPSTVVLFEYGDVIYKQLFGFFNDPSSEYKGFTDPDNGRNCVIKKVVPQGNKRQTDYFTEMRVSPSKLIDKSVLNRMYDLQNVVELIQTQKVKPYYQSQLPEGRTEMRVLPSWLGPRFTVFYSEVQYHYISKEEFDAIASGRINPFSSVGVKSIVPPKEEIVVSEPTEWGQQGWGENIPNPQPQTPEIEEENVVKPPCFKAYNDKSPLCTIRCLSLGFAEECQKLSKAAVAPAEADQKSIRETAARLYKT